MLLQEALQQVLQHLDEQGVAAALLGGLAVSVWTEPRFTRDVDLAVAVASDADAERVIVRAGHLVALKLLAHDADSRPQDGLDLRALRDALNNEELALARDACALIEARGYARGRDLPKLLEQLVGSAA